MHLRRLREGLYFKMRWERERKKEEGELDKMGDYGKPISAISRAFN